MTTLDEPIVIREFPSLPSFAIQPEDIAPGRKTGTGKTAPPASDGPNRLKESRRRDLTPALTNFYVTIGTTLAIFPATQLDAQVIIENAEVAAKSLAEYADRNLSVYKALEKMLNASGIGAVLVAHAPIIFGIMMNHNIKLPGMSALFTAPEEKKENDTQQQQAA